MTIYNLVVIGAGPGGYIAAITAAKHGLRTLLIEREQEGGTCLNRGCIPTKALLYCAERYHEAKNGKRFGVRATVEPFDYAAASVHREGTIKRLRAGVGLLVKESGATYLRGEAELLNAHTLQVENEQYQFENLIIATGSVPAPFPFVVEQDAHLVNSDGFLAMKNIPETCAVIGGGVIGLEFATILAKIDRKVIVIESMERVLPTLDVALGQVIRCELEGMGVVFHTNALVQRVAVKEGKTVCELTSQGKEFAIGVDLAICAVGRRGNTSGLSPLAAGLTLKKGFLETDDYCATSIPNIFAIGDVNGACMLAHAASYQGKKVVEQIVRGTHHPILTVSVPSCVYTDPELATVGLTEAESKEQGFDVRVGTCNALANGKLVGMGRRAGMVRLIADAKTNRLLGAQLAVPHATDMIAELSLALQLGVTMDQLAATIHPHPTIAEMIADAAEQISVIL